VEEPSGWLAQGISAAEHFFFRMIDLVLEGNPSDIRYWAFWALAMSMIWATAWAVHTKIKNNGK
jgi:hypothetical protein